MSLDRIAYLLSALESDTPHFPPTILYEEGWLLRLILDWFAHNRMYEHPLRFLPDATWYSEGSLYSAFQATYRGDPLSETPTRADGVIGHFEISEGSKTGLRLLPDTRQFIVLEAKMNSKLSSGITNAPDYDQAARTVACIAEMLHRANTPAPALDTTGFYVLAPARKIANGDFSAQLKKASIEGKVRKRVESYGSDELTWYHNWFLPLLQVIDIREISWEDIIDFIIHVDEENGTELNTFYQKCLQFN